MINLDRAAAASPYPRFDADLNRAIRLWRPYAGDLDIEILLDDTNKYIANAFGFQSDQIHWFSSGSSAINWLAENTDRMFYCSAAEHSCSRKNAHWIVPIVNGKIQTQQIQKDAIFVISLRNNELGFAPDEDTVYFLLNRPKEMLLVVDATGSDIDSPLIASADAVFASPSKWGAIPGCGFLLSRISSNLHARADRWTGFGLGTPSIAAMLTTSGAIEWIKSSVGVAAYARNPLRAQKIKDLAFELGWTLNGEGQDILNFDIRIPSDVFLAELLAKGVRLSRGAACLGDRPSEVVSNLFSEEIAERSIRISWDRLTKIEDIASAMNVVREIYDKCKKSIMGT